MAIKKDDKGYYKIIGFDFEDKRVQLRIFRDEIHRQSGNTNFLKSNTKWFDIGDLPEEAYHAVLESGYTKLKSLDMFAGFQDC